MAIFLRANNDSGLTIREWAGHWPVGRPQQSYTLTGSLGHCRLLQPELLLTAAIRLSFSFLISS